MYDAEPEDLHTNEEPDWESPEYVAYDNASSAYWGLYSEIDEKRWAKEDV